MTKLSCFVVCGIIASGIFNQAAGANFDRSTVDGTSFVNLTGIIASGDSEKFQAIVASLAPPVVVVLSSEGGAVIDSLSIGEAIRSRRFFTAIPNDTTCASACGLVWLAGTRRFIGRTGYVGFHAAYIRDGAEAQETGMGNALVGAYLSRLGLSYSAIALVTSAHPNDMMWLHPAEAQKAGIDVILLPDPEPAHDRPREPAASPFEPVTATVERRMIDLANNYYGYWSLGGSKIEGLASFYGDPVNLYGAPTSLEKLMDAKRKFAARWPIRHYSIEKGTLAVQCAELCTLTGIVAWDAASEARNAHATGTATFTLKVVPKDSIVGGSIILEDGSVISNRKSVLALPPPAVIPVNITKQLTPEQQRQIGNAIRPCYREDTNVKKYSTFAATITITIDANGTSRVAALSNADKSRSIADPMFRAFVDYAMQTVLDSACAKLPIPNNLLGRPGVQLTIRFRP